MLVLLMHLNALFVVATKYRNIVTWHVRDI